MVLHVQTHVGCAVLLGLVFSVISGATPNKAAVETVEIDGKGHQKTKNHEVHHAKHEAKHTHQEHSHEEKATHAGKESHEVHNAKKATEAVQEGAAHASKAKGEEHHAHAAKAKAEEHHKHADKEQPAHAASMAQQNVFSDEEEDDAALDELEAMTIARTFERKNTPPWGPPAAEPCTWQEWENEGSCAFTCGGRGKNGQKMTRGKNPAKHGGSGCHGKTSKQVECAIDTCPTTVTTTEEEMTTTTAGGAPRMADLSNLAFLSSLAYALSLFA